MVIANSDINIFAMVIFSATIVVVSSFILSRRSLWPATVAIVFFVAALGAGVNQNEARLAALVMDFKAGKELICEGNHGSHLLATNKTYKLRDERLLFNGDHGIDIIDNECSSEHTQKGLTIDEKILYSLAAFFYMLSVIIQIRDLTSRKK